MKYTLILLFIVTSERIYSQNKIIDSLAIFNWTYMGADRLLSYDGDYLLYNTFTSDLNGNHSSSSILLATNGSCELNLGATKSNCFSPRKNSMYFVRNDSLFCFALNLKSFQFLDLATGVTFSKPTFPNWLAYRKKSNSDSLVIFNTETLQVYYFINVTDFKFDSNEKVMVLCQNEKNGKNSQSLSWFSLVEKSLKLMWHSIDSTQEVLLSFSGFDRRSEKMSFLVSNKKCSDTTISQEANYDIWYYETAAEGARLLLKCDDKKVKSFGDYSISQWPVKFSTDGEIVFFKLEKKEFRSADPDGPSVDIWSTKDRVLQSSQLFQTGPRTYWASILAKSLSVSKLTDDYEEIVSDMDNFIVMAQDTSGDRFWFDQYSKKPVISYFLIDLVHDTKIDLKLKGVSEFYFCPNGKYLVYYNSEKGNNFYSVNLQSHEVINISKGVTPGVLGVRNEFMHGEFNNQVASFGIMGWVEKDEGVVVCDHYDIWILYLAGKEARNLTGGLGRKNKIKFRIAQPNDITTITKTFDKNQNLILLAFNTKNKYNGFYKVNLSVKNSLQKCFMGPYVFDQLGNYLLPLNGLPFDVGIAPLKAEKDSVWVVSRQSDIDFPNYFLTRDFSHFEKLTNLASNKDYNWLTSSLVNYKQLDGLLTQGILYKPQNFDNTKQYPVIFNYYQQFSHRMYEFPQPYFMETTINIPWFVSRGYIVFTPDIHYSFGRSGRSAYNSVMGAVKYLSKLPYIDLKALALNGHSFAGGETNYIITHTNKFAAALVGAGVSDVISSALTLSGAQLQERSRLNGTERNKGYTIWENPEIYLSESPILRADKIFTPTLIFHSRSDGAVPWEQGLELFIALRRLNRVAWLLQYDNEPHGNWVRKSDAIDFTVRITQFFDHYLKLKDAPKWMRSGIPARLKGIELGLEME